MTILSRYLARSLLVTSVGGILIFVFILITGNVLRDSLTLLAQGTLSFGVFVRLLGLLVPFAFSFAMPLGVLVGVLLVMGRLSANHELTAIKAAGISLYAVAAPLLLVAVLGSVLAAYLNAVHVPAARASYRAILNDLVRADPLRFIVPRTFIHDFPGYVLYVGEKEGDRMRQFWLWELDEQRRAVRLLRAESGEFEFDESQDALILTLAGGYTELRDPANPDNLRAVQPTLSFRDARIRLPLANLLGGGHVPRRISHYSLGELLELERSARARLAGEALAAADRESARADLVRARYQISRRFAMACSVFALALFAIPLGLHVGRTETYANIAVALAIAMVYYLALVVIGWAENNPRARPDLLLWLPNFTAIALGFVLLRRAQRH